MDDSSIFIQWAMEALGQGQDAAVAGDAFSSSPFLEPHHSAALQSGTDMAAHRYGATDDSRSSGNSGAALAKENNGWSSNCSTNYPAVSPNFTSGSVAPPSHGVPEPAHRSPPSRKSSPSNNGTASTGQEHVMAERKRREKLNRHFIEHSTVIPGLKKMDKTTILSDAVRYVKEQQEKLKALQDRDKRIIDSVVLVKRPCISNVDHGSPSPPPSAVARTSPTLAKKTLLPEIDARILEGNVMVDEGFNITVEDIVCKLHSALRPCHHIGK
ncbi:transcription factor bHLH18 [Triticum aestivum]|uniref:transcription factor bHLH18 n=1 Tax=Triticum aestivum TaxID=4565 RepID=UPI001D006EF9|nr:transcription factor bHLH18-like [Triticum aestivum]